MSLTGKDIVGPGCKPHGDQPCWDLGQLSHHLNIFSVHLFHSPPRERIPRMKFHGNFYQRHQKKAKSVDFVRIFVIIVLPVQILHIMFSYVYLFKRAHRCCSRKYGGVYETIWVGIVLLNLMFGVGCFLFLESRLAHALTIWLEACSRKLAHGVFFFGLRDGFRCSSLLTKIPFLELCFLAGPRKRS